MLHSKDIYIIIIIHINSDFFNPVFSVNTCSQIYLNEDFIMQLTHAIKKSIFFKFKKNDFAKDFDDEIFSMTAYQKR